MLSKKIIVAIDGHSSCGKSTMAKWLAKQVGYIYIDTGAMYRAVTLFAIRKGLFNTDNEIDTTTLQQLLPEVKLTFVLDDETGQPLICLNGEVVEKEIRGMEVSSKVSPIAALACVREKLTAEQQMMGREKGIVMDGRDIGTAVFPDAELKVFVTASAEVRAQRRLDELKTKGDTTTTFADVLLNVEERDYIDSHREVNPLRQADDAVVLDNSNMTFDEQNKFLLDLFNDRRDR